MSEFPGQGPLHRAATVTKAAGGTFSVAVSSEVVVVRDGWLGKWREVLDHSPGSVELARFKSGAAAVLVDHGGDQVGVVASAQLDQDRVLRARIKFSQSARGQEVQRDVEDGIRRNISVGYLPKKAVLVEENKELGNLWRVMAWEPLELSIVAVPADTTVGVGRSAAGASPRVTEVSMSEHAAEIAELASGYGMSERAGEWIRAGKTPDDVRRLILESRATPVARPTASAESLEEAGLSKRDRSRYSYARALRVAAGLEDGGLEGELSRELERFMPAEAKRRGGVLIPLQLATRSLVSNVGTKGAEAVFEQAGDLIELLRNKTQVVELGARVLTGLTSPIGFPKQTAAMTAVWTGENSAAISEADPTLALAMLAPKTVMSATSYSRQFLLQSSLDVEQWVRDDMAAVHARAVDLAAIHGLGAAGEPTGVYKAVGVGVKAMGGVPTFGKLIDMLSGIAGANGDTGALGFLTTPAMAGVLAQTLVASSAGSDMLWQGSISEGTVAGIRARSTNQCSAVMNGSERTGGTSHALVCGVWSELVLGLFGVLEVVVDPYSSKKKGLIEVASFQMADVLVRHGESFTKATGATLT